jgi:hypothetical protein
MVLIICLIVLFLFAFFILALAFRYGSWFPDDRDLYLSEMMKKRGNKGLKLIKNKGREVKLIEDIKTHKDEEEKE